MLKLRTLLLCNYLFLTVGVIGIFYSLVITNFYNRKSLYNINDNEVTGIINYIFIDGNHLKLEMKGKEKIIVNYFFKTKIEKESFNLSLGDKIKVTGKMNIPSSNRVFNLFNYQKYLSNKGIFFLFNGQDIELIHANKSIIYNLKKIIINQIQKVKKTQGYLKTFILGDKNYLQEEVLNSYRSNGIGHLFAISGMHVTFLSLVLLELFKKIKITEYKRYLLVIFFLFFYLFLTNFSASVFRAVLFFVFFSINKIYYFHIKTINILCLTLFLILIINPYFINDIGFQFSFMISFALIMMHSFISEKKGYLKKLFWVSFISFLVAIPLSANYFYQINIFGPLINVIFVPLISLIIFPLSLITFFIPLFDNFLYILINIMEKTSLILHNYKLGVIILAKPNILIISFYYLMIIYLLFNLNKDHYKKMVLMIPILLVHNNINYFNFKPYLVFIDVGQGDSILINLPYNQGIILIDTGGRYNFNNQPWATKNKNNSIASNLIIPYLKSEGIKRIDYLFITHGHIDHMGEALELVDSYKVKNLVFNGVKSTNSELSLIKALENQGKTYFFAQEGDAICIKTYCFYILHPSKDINTNDNSLVIYTVLNNKHILLTGDISSSIEKKIINTYNFKGMDILKIAHHGSLTSSDEMFLDSLNPKYAVIQVSKNNKFNHPHPVVMERLKKREIKTFLTSNYGSVRFNLYKKEVTIDSVISYDILEH